MRKFLANVVERGLLLVVLGLAGCATPFGGRGNEPSPKDTVIVQGEPPNRVVATSKRRMAPPRRPEPEPEEVLIVEPEIIVPIETKPVGTTYVVRKGDCLSWIAKKFKIPLKDILEANALDRNAKLSIGQRLVLPGVTEGQVNAMNTAPSEYIVKKGDCLSLIAHKYGVGVREIRAANGLKNDSIVAGKKLIIPERGRYAGHKGDSQSKGTKKEKNFPVDADGYYTIRKGDSLSKIALKAKVSVHDLQNWNNISDPTKIRVGERILVKNKTITPADVIKNGPTPSIRPEPLSVVRDTDFFGTIDEIPVVQVQD
jgi:LysM repeat protein